MCEMLVLPIEEVLQPLMTRVQESLAKLFGVPVSSVVAKVAYLDDGRLTPHLAIDREKVFLQEREIVLRMRKVWASCRPQAALLTARAREQWHEFGQ